MDDLRRQMSLSQFINTTGCPRDEATKTLTASNWQLDVRVGV